MISSNTSIRILSTITSLLIIWFLATSTEISDHATVLFDDQAGSSSETTEPLSSQQEEAYNYTAISINATASATSDQAALPTAESEISVPEILEVPEIPEFPELPTDPLILDRVAVIIEDRPLSTLIPLLLHFASVLGPTWPVLIYTSNDLAAILKESAVLSRWSHQIGHRILPYGVKFDGHDATSRFLTEPWFWDDLAPAEHVLLFQADSIICANAPQSVDDFLGYDFVGAPVAEPYGQGYNGGLSIRNRQKMLDIITAEDWFEHKGEPNSKFEDQWFFRKMKDLPNIMLPSSEVAKRFVVETIYYEKPLGYHQAQRWQSSHMQEIEEWCPEVKLTVGGKFV